MIKVESPSMVIVSDDLKQYGAYLNYNITVAASDPIDVVIKQVQDIGTKEKLRFVYILCHGFYDKAPGGSTSGGGFGLNLGTGVRRSDLPKLRALRGLVDSIWLGSCGAARQTTAGATGERLGGDGTMFCSEMAQAAGAYVVAATTVQIHPSDTPFGYIDDYEGVVLQFGPLGNIVWQHDYGRTLLDWLRYPSG